MTGFGWGIVATGKIARTVATVIAGTGGMRVAAVASRSKARARDFATEFGATGAHDSVAALCADPAVSAVYVASPHSEHADAVEVALAAGMPVLCEKPLTDSLDATERAVAAAASHGVFLMEGMWMRFNPLVDQLLSAVSEGAIGEIRSVRASFGFAAPYDPSSRLFAPTLGGGALLDVGIYPVQLARMLLGEPVGLHAHGTLADTGVDEEVAMLLTFGGGAHALLEASLRTSMPAEAIIVGSEGHAELGPRFHAPTELRLTSGKGTLDRRRSSDRYAGFVAELREVRRCVLAGLAESPMMPLADSLATMRVLDTARKHLPG